MSILLNKKRIGNFTSSDIHKLTTVARNGKDFGKPALTYIKKKNQERRLGRSISVEANAKPLTWGNLLEGRAFGLMSLDYTLNSTETIVHQTIDYWSGSPDGFKYDESKTVIDFKAPITLDSFCDLVDPLYAGLTGMDAMNAIRENHDCGEAYYQQLVSNAILTNSQFCELIVYVPYLSELPVIREMAQMVESDMLGKHYWIAMATENELPYLVDGGYYKNLNIIRFPVSEEDKTLLTECVLRAGAMLISIPSAIISTYEPEIQSTIIEGIKLTKILKTV